MITEKNLIYLNGNDSEFSYLAVGAEHELKLYDEDGAWEKVRSFLDVHTEEYVFGWFGYELKNDIEKLESRNPVWVNTPVVYLMVPSHLGVLRKGRIDLLKGSLDEVSTIHEQLSKVQEKKESTCLEAYLEKNAYLEKINRIKEHIQLGDIYEANFCYEYRGSGKIDPLVVYQNLNNRTKAPFSVYAKVNELNVLSASPERFLKKEGSRIFTQPIKGTIRRGETPEKDLELMETLRTNPKDRAENIMIVDLVRNDLSRIAKPKSVRVEQLCEIYTFENIHQMISTVSAEVDDKHPVDILKALFPMGSMTGAPKIRAMELMEKYEVNRRGLYSGCIGYFTPERDFDFNVVIRTIFHDQHTAKSSFSVGGAITALSSAEGEYDETILKAKALIEALT